MALLVRGAIDGPKGTVTVEVENRADDAIGIDVDAIRLRDSRGGRHAALGAPRRFVRAGGERVVRRVPYGAVSVSPRSRQSIELEFADLPEKESFSLVVPALYLLGIEGQVGLRAIRVPLRAGDETAAPAPSDGGWFDPFEE